MAELTGDIARGLCEVERVDIGEHHVFVRTLPASAISDLEHAKQLDIAAMLLCTQDGTPRDEDVTAWPMWAVTRIVEHGLSLNGLGESVEDRAEK